MMPISMANTGTLVTIKKISGNDEVRQHLATLGFVVGEKVSVVSENCGNMILNVKDSRIALDRTLANRILV
ncbi:FeoA family protein [Butyrivibrio proteoclasticus]|uniref:FeoA family protein n=1 Tax=Butyrivibrio proteoclasticus TaxID=43305 RepID=UPI00047D66C9|nr:FeoA family protein [Butyrivibrio proteoclasticus]